MHRSNAMLNCHNNKEGLDVNVLGIYPLLTEFSFVVRGRSEHRALALLSRCENEH